jgi:hypothetical protein
MPIDRRAILCGLPYLLMRLGVKELNAFCLNQDSPDFRIRRFYSQLNEPTHEIPVDRRAILCGFDFSGGSALRRPAVIGDAEFV